MAWIESHQSLRMHTKTLTAVASLRCDRHKFLGHLMCLWWWGLEVADLDGKLPDGTTPAIIAAGAEWPINRAQQLTDALIGARFLEEVEGRFILHDWWDYAGKYNAKRAANKQRMRESRATHVQRTDVERATHVQGLPDQPVQPVQNNLPVLPTGSTSEHGGDAARIDEVASAFARFGKVTSGTSQAIEYAVKDYGLDWVQRAVKVASGAAFDDKPGWNYVESICERWQKQGGPDDDRPRVQTPVRANGRQVAPDAGDLDARIARLAGA